MRISVLLWLHVRKHDLGFVCGSPADVVLDEQKALVVQPDVFFVAKERMSIVRNQVWGAPDLVVEVASRGTAKYDRTIKLEWYRKYGVRECWLVDLKTRAVTVVNLRVTDESGSRRYIGEASVKSVVLPMFATQSCEFFS